MLALHDGGRPRLRRRQVLRRPRHGDRQPRRHPYLAAFDRDTGAWISSFDPDLDGTVWDLEVVGRQADRRRPVHERQRREPDRGLAALDPITGAVDPTGGRRWTLSGSSDRPYARSARRRRASGSTSAATSPRSRGRSVTRAMGRLGRVAVADGRPDNAFRPRRRRRAVRHRRGRRPGLRRRRLRRRQRHGAQGSRRLDWTTGAPIAGLQPPVQTAGNFDRQYQQAVLAVGNEVWQGGSEHNTQAYAEADYGLPQVVRHVRRRRRHPGVRRRSTASSTRQSRATPGSTRTRPSGRPEQLHAHRRLQVGRRVRRDDARLPDRLGAVARHGEQRGCVGAVRRPADDCTVVRRRLRRRTVRQRPASVPRGVLQVLPARHPGADRPVQPVVDALPAAASSSTGAPRATTSPASSATRCCATTGSSARSSTAAVHRPGRTSTTATSCGPSTRRATARRRRA